jgi:hypothetical protein
MHSLLKSAVLAAGVLVGVAGIANAQSVSSLPPAGPATAPTATTSSDSSAKIYPDPGSGTKWKEEHYQAAQSANEPPERHPYSTPHFGPAPN